MSESKADVAIYHSGRCGRDESIAEEQTMTYSSKKLKLIFYIAAVAFAASSGASFGVYDLQSSINISEGLGVTSMLTTSAVSLLSTLLLVPYILDFHGPKITLILCEISASLFALANLYPRYFTFLPASILVGLTEGGLWTAISTVTNFVGERLAKIDNELDKTAKVSWYFGILSFMFSSGQLILSGISFAVLNSLKPTNETESYSEWENTSLESSGNSDVFEEEETDWSLCVANDCQANYVYNITEKQLDSYSAMQYSIYVLMGVFAAMHLGAAALTWSFLPRIPARYDKVLGFNRPSVFSALGTEIRKTFMHFISIQHLLFLPTTFYFGTNIIYSISDFNRAYISCTIGVERIGLLMAISGISCMTASVAVSFIAPKIGRIPIYLAAVCIDGVFFFAGLFWVPTPSNIYILYILSMMNGFTNGLWLIASSIITSVFFSDRTEIAFSTQMLSVSVGALVAHSWSIPLCVYQKIYINLAVLSLATLFYSIAEVRHRRALKEEPKISEKDKQIELTNQI